MLREALSVAASVREEMDRIFDSQRTRAVAPNADRSAIDVQGQPVR
jgi:hypothetical protein